MYILKMKKVCGEDDMCIIVKVIERVYCEDDRKGVL